MTQKEQISRLLEGVRELQEVVDNLLERTENTKTLIDRIKEEIAQLESTTGPGPVLTDSQDDDDFASSYEIEDDDEEETTESETDVMIQYPVAGEGGYIADIDEDSAFGCYADFLPEAGTSVGRIEETASVEQEAEDDEAESGQDAEDDQEDKPVFDPVAETPGDRAAKSNLRKSFSLNDMFRFAVLFGGRNALVEVLAELDGTDTPEVVDEIIRSSLRKGSDEEVVAEFIEKVHTEKF